MEYNVSKTARAEQNRMVNYSNPHTQNKAFESLSSAIEVTAQAMLLIKKGITTGNLLRLENRLMDMLLQIKGFKAFSTTGNVYDKTMEECYKSDYYSGIVMAQCYQMAWKKYLKLSVVYGDNRIIGEPFLKYFNTIYKIKSADIIREHCLNINQNNVNAKKAKLMYLLIKVKKRNGFTGPTKRFEVLNQPKFVEALEFYGATEDDFKEAQIIFQTSYVESDAQYDDNGEASDTYTSDKAACEDYYFRQLTLMKIVDTFEEALKAANAENDPVVAENLKYYFTLKALDIIRQDSTATNLYLLDFLDKDLMKFAVDFKSTNEDEIFSEYLHQKYNTARKKLRKVEKWLIEWDARKKA